MSDTPISELDFFAVKDQLKTFLSSQERFKDYDFEGSNMSVLLDIMAYNTYHNNFYTNMAVSEMFLDSSRLDNSISSHAKALNYLPKSMRSSSAGLAFRLSVSDTPAFITIPEKTKFLARGVNNETYSFYNRRSATITPVDGVYKISCLDVYEGTYVEELFTSTGSKKQIITMTNENIDIDSLRVFVSDVDRIKEVEYIFKENIFGVSNTDKVFYLQQAQNKKYALTFGQGVFGAQPIKNQVIRVTYQKTAGTDANGMTGFSAPNKIDGYTVGTISIVSPSNGGSDRESADSIKFNAPKSIQVQERAVTESDYRNLLLTNFPEIEAVSIIGGEKLSPPRYGKVAVIVDVFGSDGISTNTKDKIPNYLEKKTPLGIEAIVLSPNFMYIELNTVVTYDATTSKKNDADIRKASKEAIIQYAADNLNDFGKTVRFSKLTNAIDASDSNIVSNNTRIRAVVDLVPSTSKTNDFVVRFGNEVVPIADYALRALQSQVPNHPVIPILASERSDRLPTIASSPFTYNGRNVYLRDNGFGVLQVIRNTDISDSIVLRDVGTVNYTTGTVVIKKLQVDATSSGILKLYATIKNSDIAVPKDHIVTIREEDITITVKNTTE
jgi:hypothetical protein